MRVVVLSDLHANGRALAAALAAARALAPDRLVLLGDVLTYGLDVRRSVELVADAVLRDGASLLIGNHDQLYFDLEAGETAYFDGLPPWIRESVEHTRAGLNLRTFRDGLPWKTEERIGAMYLAHANPFGFGDWSYLNDATELARAGVAVAAFGATIGVFGHNHRGAIHRIEAGSVASVEVGSLREAPGVLVMNPGSVGQPRSRDRASSMLVIDDTKGLRVSLEPVAYDVAAHVADLNTSDLSAETRAKLASFF